MKNISLNKYLKLFIKLSILVTYFLILFGAWSTQYQKTVNEQLFAKSRTVNGLGVLFLFIGWGFWEFYASAKKPKWWQGFIGIILTLCATIMINGLLGLVGGFIAIGITSFLLVISHFKLFTKKERIINGS